MLCISCHKREATRHFINKNGGVQKTANLCDECFKLVTGALAAVERNAHCEYCGGGPCSGGADFLALVAGVQKTQHLCVPCSVEHNRFIQEQMLDENPNLSQQQQVADLRKLKGKVDAHMKEWVANKNPK